MNWGLRDVQAASLWQFDQKVKGWKQANCKPDDPKPLSNEQHDSLNWDF